MTVRVSVNYNDPRWKRCDLKKYVTLLMSKTIQTNQMRLTGSALSVLACGDSKIRELNKIYRKKDKATNVLAWPAIDCFSHVDQDYRPYGKNNYLFLGDIAISYERCSMEASFQNIPLNRYCCKLLLHAILHLLGYDHDISMRTSKMQLMETRVLNSVLTNRPKFNNN
jgi:probable rRNA maturation factor